MRLFFLFLLVMLPFPEAHSCGLSSEYSLKINGFDENGPYQQRGHIALSWLAYDHSGQVVQVKLDTKGFSETFHLHTDYATRTTTIYGSWPEARRVWLMEVFWQLAPFLGDGAQRVVVAGSEFEMSFHDRWNVATDVVTRVRESLIQYDPYFMPVRLHASQVSLYEASIFPFHGGKLESSQTKDPFGQKVLEQVTIKLSLKATKGYIPKCQTSLAEVKKSLVHAHKADQATPVIAGMLETLALKARQSLDPKERLEISTYLLERLRQANSASEQRRILKALGFYGGADVFRPLLTYMIKAPYPMAKVAFKALKKNSSRRLPYALAKLLKDPTIHPALKQDIRSYLELALDPSSQDPAW